jgi:hypothetical protein
MARLSPDRAGGFNEHATCVTPLVAEVCSISGRPGSARRADPRAEARARRISPRAAM